MAKSKHPNSRAALRWIQKEMESALYYNDRPLFAAYVYLARGLHETTNDFLGWWYSSGAIRLEEPDALPALIEEGRAFAEPLGWATSPEIGFFWLTNHKGAFPSDFLDVRACEHSLRRSRESLEYALARGRGEVIAEDEDESEEAES